MVAKKLNSNFLFHSMLGLLAVMGFYGLWVLELSLIIRWAVVVLFVISLYQSYKKDTSALLFVVGFVVRYDCFALTTKEVIPNAVCALIISLVVLFLFGYRQVQTKKAATLGRLFSAYNSLLALLTAELFYVLTFFPIEAKNKALLVVLCLWAYDELLEHYEQKQLTRLVAIRLGVIFFIIFFSLALTFPFETGL